MLSLTSNIVRHHFHMRINFKLIVVSIAMSVALTSHASSQVNETNNMTSHLSAEENATLGDKHYFGRGVEQDYQEAMKWYRLAAEQGDIKAQAILGWMYEEGGRGTEKK